MMKDISPAVAVNGGHFSLPSSRLLFFPDPTQAEAGLFARAAAGEAAAQLWHSPLSLVVPGSYKRFAALEPVRQRFAAAGCPVFLRKSGGGLVPQGPGIVNISLAYKIARPLGEAAEEVYRHLCAILGSALAERGVAAHWQAVAGSFCDGRFNLACGDEKTARKIAGTAQYWQPVANQPAGGARHHVVLAHAALLVDCDLAAAHRHANQFEAALGCGRYYQAEKTVSVAQMAPDATGDLRDEMTDALRAAILRSPAPL
ncbi:lipoate--protein ligase family protein [Enterobacter cloacae complex sp. P29RS]|uniref:lipoyl protein ligase domain-containing protein n=1 Tax=Enterobacter cloacae complex sp. P29RS TaxID=2779563 RepID=UPI001865C1E0|nr:lipoate--protein ligase family protein [Enterobacter cloacae complex sp. P29RS]MBE3175381.1 lipoate--protein ligase family protein [Enterobacter cloacae complex sp. P29RS]